MLDKILAGMSLMHEAPNDLRKPRMLSAGYPSHSTPAECYGEDEEADRQDKKMPL